MGRQCKREKKGGQGNSLLGKDESGPPTCTISLYLCVPCSFRAYLSVSFLDMGHGLDWIGDVMRSILVRYGMVWYGMVWQVSSGQVGVDSCIVPLATILTLLGGTCGA